MDDETMHRLVEGILTLILTSLADLAGSLPDPQATWACEGRGVVVSSQWLVSSASG